MAVSAQEIKRELFKQTYSAELEGRVRILAKVSVPLSLIGALFVAVVFLAKQSEPAEAGILRLLFGFSFAIMLVLFIVSVVLLFVVLSEAKYLALPECGIINEYHKKLEDYYKEYPQALPETITQRFDSFLIDLYRICADKNSIINQRRTAFLLWINRAMFATLIMIVISWCFLFFPRVEKWVKITTAPLYKTEEVNTVESESSQSKSSSPANTTGTKRD